MEDIKFYLNTEAGQAALQAKLDQLCRTLYALKSTTLDLATTKLSYEMLLFLQDKTALNPDSFKQFEQLIVFLCDTISSSMRAVRVGMGTGDADADDDVYDDGDEASDSEPERKEASIEEFDDSAVAEKEDGDDLETISSTTDALQILKFLFSERS